MNRMNEWMNEKKIIQVIHNRIPFLAELSHSFANVKVFYKWISTGYIFYSAHIHTVRLGVITFLSWCFEAKAACNSKWSIFSFARPTAVRKTWRANSERILTGVWNRFGWLESASRCSSSVVHIIASLRPRAPLKTLLTFWHAVTIATKTGNHWRLLKKKKDILKGLYRI